MLAAYPGVDVLDPGVSLRRVHVLLERLPPHARRGGEAWSIESELLAGLIDHVAQLTYITLKAYGAKSVKKPKPVPRPEGRRQLTETAAARPVPTPVADSAAPPSPQSRSWMDAAGQLAGIAGVRVRTDG